MTDTTVTTETPPTTPSTETPQPNTPEARNADGSLRDQTAPLTTTPEPKPNEPSTPTKKDGTSTVPETYADFTAPEGYTVDKALIDAAVPLFKDLGLTQEQAQKLVDFQAQRQIELAKAPQETYETMRADWRKEVLADTELASAGKVKPEVLSAIAKGIDSLGADVAKSFREIMDISGVGDNPAFVKAMYKFGQLASEGSHVTGKGPAPTGQTAPDAKPLSIANAMYPNLK